MSDDEATPGRLRFIPKKLGEGRSATWRVYDLQSGGFPYQSPELGTVVQDKAEAEIKTECDRLTAAHGYLNLKRKAEASKPKAPTAAPLVEDEEEDED